MRKFYSIFDTKVSFGSKKIKNLSQNSKFSKIKSFSISVFALMMLIGNLCFGQTGTIQIGSGTTTGSIMPLNSYFGYNYSQQIVTASEYGATGAAGNITKIRFYCGSLGSDVTKWNNWTIYLGHTTKSSFSSTSDWVPVANLTQVFDGTFTPTAASWIEFTLPTPFNYNGSDNLIVAVYEKADGYTSFGNSATFRTYTSTSNTGLYKNSDTQTDVLPTAPASGTRTATLPQIQFEGTLASCLSATAVSSSNITSSGASVSWTAPSTVPANGYEVYYSTSNTAPGDSPTGTEMSASTSINLSSLSPQTTYYVWVRSLCSGTDKSVWSSVASFTTLCAAYTIPYSENFDTTTTGNSTTPSAPQCWKFAKTTGGAGYGYTYAGNYATSPNSFYLYNSSDTTGSYMLVSPETTDVSNGQNRVKFSAKGGSTGYSLVVGTLSNPTDVSTFTPIQTVNLTNAVQNFSVNIPSGSNKYVAFKNGLGGTYRAIYLDNIFFEAIPSCDYPTAVSSVITSTTSATVSWTAPGVPPANGYEYYLSTSNTAPDATTAVTGSSTTTSVDLSNLTAETYYYIWVRSSCSDTEKSTWSTGYSFFTGHCIPSAGSSSTSYYLNNISTTGAMTNLSYTASSYSAYVDQSSSNITSYPGGVINYSLASSTTATYYYYIWIDWNNDLDFGDTGETVLATTSYAATNSGTLTIPAGTATGNYKVRIASSESGAITPCGPAPYGNYVDFKLVITEAPAPITITGDNTLCGGESTTLTATSNDTTYTYTWSPSTGLDTTTGTTVVATPTATTTYTVTGVSGLKTTSSSITVTVNPLPSNVSISPSTATICKDATQALTATGGNIDGYLNIGNGTLLTDTSSNGPASFNNRWGTFRTQTIYTAAELQAAGIVAGTISSLSYNITTNGDAVTNNNYTVRIGTTTNNSYPDTNFINTGLVTVYGPATYTHDYTLGWNEIVFTTPYVWDGVSNIVIDVYMSGANQYYSARTYYSESNNAALAQYSTTTTSTTGTLSNQKLNIKLKAHIPSTLSWSPTTDLYTDAAATIPYAGGNSATVYFKTANQTLGDHTYTATATSPAGCSTSASATITVDDCLSVEDINGSAKGISIYPNPVEMTLNIKSDKAITAVSVFDLSGALVLSNKGNDITSVEVASLKTGTYVIKTVNVDGNVETKKLIKK